jgi:hypothetical protein
MTADALWQIAMGLLRPMPKPAFVRFELMSNEDLDRWLDVHQLA